MIIALYGVACAMVVSGLAALIQGYDIIMVERGWTLVIAGVIAIASGALLAGLAYAAARLVQIHEDVVGLRDDLSHLFPRRSGLGGGTGTAFVADAFASALNGAVLNGAGPDAAPPEREGAGRPPEENPRDPVDRAGSGPASPLLAFRTAPALGPALGTAPALGSTPAFGTAPALGTAPGPEILATTIEPVNATAPDAPPPKPPANAAVDDAVESFEAAIRPAPDHPKPADPKPAAPQPAAAEEPSPAFPSPILNELPMVVGTYDSGGNRYVMYSDGSIEADTPTGLFRFKSLDELKEFVASGGETGGSAS